MNKPKANYRCSSCLRPCWKRPRHYFGNGGRSSRHFLCAKCLAESLFEESILSFEVAAC